MNEMTKRRALLAASKLTFSTMVAGVTVGMAFFGAVACGDDEANVPVGERDGTQPGNEQNAAKQPEEKTPSAAATSTTPKADPPPKKEEPAPVAAVCNDAACCNAKVGPLLSDEDAWVWEDEKKAAIRERLGPDGIACCQLIVAVAAQTPDEERSPDHWACCGVLDDNASDAQIGACTPWGPPTPPSFDDDRLARSLLAVVA